MNMSLFPIIATAFVGGATVVLFVMRLKHNLAASERRMVIMLERVGLDPAIALSGEPDSIIECMIEGSMKKIRQRCRACSTVNECERWIAGNDDSDNVFCPNVRVFGALRIVCDDVANNHPTLT